MRALLQADRSAQGRNVVDLRGVLVDRLEERLDRLEDTHREVLAAAYENVAGMNQVHRACLARARARRLRRAPRVLTRDVAPILGVEVIRLGLEAPAAEPGAPLGPDGPCRDVVVALPAGGVDAYVTQGRGLGARRVTLRQLDRASPDFYGAEAPGHPLRGADPARPRRRRPPGAPRLRRPRRPPLPPRPGHRPPRLLRRRLRAQPAALAVVTRPRRPKGRRTSCTTGSPSSAPSAAPAPAPSPPTSATSRATSASSPSTGAARPAPRRSAASPPPTSAPGWRTSAAAASPPARWRARSRRSRASTPGSPRPRACQPPPSPPPAARGSRPACPARSRPTPPARSSPPSRRRASSPGSPPATWRW